MVPPTQQWEINPFKMPSKRSRQMLSTHQKKLQMPQPRTQMHLRPGPSLTSQVLSRNTLREPWLQANPLPRVLQSAGTSPPALAFSHSPTATSQLTPPRSLPFMMPSLKAHGLRSRPFSAPRWHRFLQTQIHSLRLLSLCKQVPLLQRDGEPFKGRSHKGFAQLCIPRT